VADSSQHSPKKIVFEQKFLRGAVSCQMDRLSVSNSLIMSNEQLSRLWYFLTAL